MSELTTDELYKKLAKAAIDKENSRIRTILDKCYSEIGLNSSCFKIFIPYQNDAQEKRHIEFEVYDLFSLIRVQRIKAIEDYLTTTAVNDFLKSVETFKNHMAELERYRLDDE
jgi:hypothetical protein